MRTQTYLFFGGRNVVGEELLLNPLHRLIWDDSIHQKPSWSCFLNFRAWLSVLSQTPCNQLCWCSSIQSAQCFPKWGLPEQALTRVRRRNPSSPSWQPPHGHHDCLCLNPYSISEGRAHVSLTVVPPTAELINSKCLTHIWQRKEWINLSHWKYCVCCYSLGRIVLLYTAQCLIVKINIYRVLTQSTNSLYQ